MESMKTDENKRNQQHSVSWKSWILILLGIAATGFLAMIALVIYVDPFFQYHKPLADFPYLVDNQLSQNPGMAKNFDYDSVMLGSSMTVNFNTDWFDELYGEKTVKLSYNGAYPKNQANIMEIIFKSHPNLKKVYLGIDIPAYSSDVDTTKYPIPEYLYDDNVLNDVSYVLNKDVLLNYIFRPLADAKDKTDFGTMYALWWTDEYFNKQYVLQYYEAPDVVDTEVPADAWISSLEDNLAMNICPYIEKYPDTEFVVFYPPYSILYWYGVNRENKLEATLSEYAYTANRLLAYDNVRLYNFQDQEEIITDLDHNYADYDHYHRDINRYMTECFGGDTCEITRDTVADTVERMRKIATSYDYDAIFR